MNAILLIVGLILTGAGVVVYIAVGGAGPEAFVRLPEGADPYVVLRIVRYGVSGLLGGLGALFTLSGLIGFGRSARQRARASQLMASGVDAEGTVTFVDKNFTILVNHTPIYSIVEYTYRDSQGREHTRRVNNLNSEMVIRKQIQVGTKIAVKYAREDPGESIMVF